jgi:hypothetical protein
MTNPRDLLRRRGAPAPIAVTMQTEIRSDGGLYFRVLQAPYWANGRGTASIWQWTTTLEYKEARLLWEYLRQPDPVYGLQPEALIDFALTTLQLGRYLGTFVDARKTPLVVRMMFGIEPDRQITEDQLNSELKKLYDYNHSNIAPTKPDGYPLSASELDQLKLASSALVKLRRSWARGSPRSDDRSQMLTGVDAHDLGGSGQFPFGYNPDD